MLTGQELSVATEPRSLVARLQGLDPPEERTDSEVVGKRLPVLIAGSPDLLPVGGVHVGARNSAHTGLTCWFIASESPT